MVGEKKAAANQRNAQQSTGPRTPEGKARSSKNAVRHGLLSVGSILLPGEREDEFSEMRDQLYGELAPRGVIQTLLVDEIVHTSWRLARIPRIETGVVLRDYWELVKSRLDFDFDLDLVSVTDTDLHATATANIESQPVTLAFAYTRGDRPAITHIQRYEAHLQRKLYRALHELERRQARDSGQYISPPVDINIEREPD